MFTISMPAMVDVADMKLLKPSIGLTRCLMKRWSCSTSLLLFDLHHLDQHRQLKRFSIRLMSLRPSELAALLSMTILRGWRLASSATFFRNRDRLGRFSPEPFRSGASYLIDNSCGGVRIYAVTKALLTNSLRRGRSIQLSNIHHKPDDHTRHPP